MINRPSDTENLKWNPTFQAQREHQFHDCQKFVDSEVLRHNSKYIPFQTGALDQSGRTGTVIGSGEVVYQSLYVLWKSNARCTGACIIRKGTEARY